MKERFDREPAAPSVLRHAGKPRPAFGDGTQLCSPHPARGSGVWVDEQKDTRARRHAAHIRNTAGRATLLPPERKLRSADTARCIGIRDHHEKRKLLYPETPAGDLNAGRFGKPGQTGRYQLFKTAIMRP